MAFIFVALVVFTWQLSTLHVCLEFISCDSLTVMYLVALKTSSGALDLAQFYRSRCEMLIPPSHPQPPPKNTMRRKKKVALQNGK